MSQPLEQRRPTAVLGAGGPLGVSNSLLGIWIFLSAECAFFASLIGSYLAEHGATMGLPGPQRLFDLPVTLAATLVLLLSSLTMVLGVTAHQRGDLFATQKWLAMTAVLGISFLGFEAFDFTTYWHQGVTLQSSAFGSSFYTLLGFHGLHVAFGVFWILSLLVRSTQLKRDESVKVMVASLYWHFVDVVWIVIFTVVYLMGKVG